MAWTAQILTLFPEMFPGPLGQSLAGKALSDGLWRLEVCDIRNFGAGKHKNVDDTPAGGGAGMVMRADVLAAAIDSVRETAEPDWPLICLSPRGLPLSEDRARQMSLSGGATLICGRYEGIDERLLRSRGIEEVSIGDYVLSGGEPAAIVVLDAVLRLLPGVMGAAESLAEESFGNGLLEYPHYTRPQIFEGQEIPEVLTSGHHENIAAWRRKMSEELTRRRRPDLWQRYELSKTETKD